MSKQRLTTNDRAELLLTDNPRVLTSHATYDHPVRKVTLTIIRQGTPDHERQRLLALAHKLAHSQNT